MKIRKAFSIIEISIVILIIGAIISGVIQGSRLVQESRLKNARILTQGSPVPGIYGLVAWWEATSIDSFSNSEANNDTPIETWKDINPQSINKIDIAQSTEDNRPLYDSDGIGNLPAVKFDGSNDLLIRPNNPPIDSQKFTFFAVIKTVSNASYPILFDNDSYGAGAGYALYISDSSNGFKSIINDISKDLTTDNLLGQAQIATYKYDGSNLTFYQSGTKTCDLPFSEFIPNKDSSTSFSIGAYTASGSYTNDDYFLHFNGHIGEIIIFNHALNNEDRESVEEYLGKKWGVAIN